MVKLFHGIATLLFITMAVIQLNDPDPLYWVVVYLSAALLSGAVFFGSRLETLSILVLGLALAGLLTSGPGALDYFFANDYAAIYGSMLGAKPYVESAREFGGLIIVVVYIGCFRGNIRLSKA